MIKANELRIGNLVNHKSFTGPVKIDGVDINGPLIQMPNEDGRDSFNYLEGAEPIPLTPEILEACGFVKDGFNQYCLTLPQTLSLSNRMLFFAGDYLYLQENNEGSKRDLVTLWNKDIMKTFYLHQLQNICYNFTGQELEVKELNKVAQSGL